MKNVLLILALPMLVSYSGHAKECSYAEIQRGCKTTHWEHCYPKSGECMTIIRCSCPNTGFLPPSDAREPCLLKNLSHSLASYCSSHMLRSGGHNLHQSGKVSFEFFRQCLDTSGH